MVKKMKIKIMIIIMKEKLKNNMNAIIIISNVSIIMYSESSQVKTVRQ